MVSTNKLNRNGGLSHPWHGVPVRADKYVALVPFGCFCASCPTVCSQIDISSHLRLVSVLNS